MCVHANGALYYLSELECLLRFSFLCFFFFFRSWSELPALDELGHTGLCVRCGAVRALPKDDARPNVC